MAAHQISTKYTDFSAGLVRELALFAASGLSLLAAAIHLWAVPEHLAEWWGYGAFFVAAALMQGLFGVALLRRPSRPLFLSGVLANLGVVALYVVTRTAGIPFVGPHAGEVHAAGALDLTATVAELALVAALVALAGEGRRARLYLGLGAVQALGTGLVLHTLHSGVHGERGLGFLAHWLQGSVLALPLSVLTLVVAGPLARAGAGYFFGENAFAARISWALAAAGAYAAAGIPANALAAHHATAGAFLAQAGRDAGAVFGIGFLLLLAVAQLRGTPWEAPRAINFWRPRAATALVGVAAALLVVVGPSAFGEMFASPVEAQAAPGSCSSANTDRSYDVAAINVDIPFNRWGDVDPDGQIYVLQQDKAAVKNWSRPLAADPGEDPAGNRRLRPRPLVIRANVGECVRVDFTNELNARQWGGRLIDPRASMQVRGVAYDAQTSDGGAVGYNEDTTARIGETKTYYWRMPTDEGLHLFRSQTMTSGEEEDAGSNAHGLYGAIAVEPAGSTWHDPVSGRELYTGTRGQSGELYVDADIRLPGTGNNDFRESVQLAQDYNEVQPGLVGHGFNYGTEPQRNREKPENLPADGLGEEVSLSSWGYGDPALVKLASGPGPWKPNVDDTGNVEDCNPNNYAGFDSTSCYSSNVTHSYQGDPTKIRYAMAGVAETHVFHMHAHQWLADPAKTADFYANPKSSKSATLDSQTFGPGETFTADLLYGAGSKPGTVGDSIFHCHLYPHFAEGFWSLFRVHDVREDGTNELPDGTNVRNLEPLPDRAAQAPPAADLEIDGAGTDNPGFPRFIPGEFGWRAPQAPGSIQEPNPDTADPDDKREATRIVAGKPLDAARLSTADPLENGLIERLKAESAAQEMLNKGDAPEPGAPFTDPCPTGAREVTYDVSVMQRDIVYNEAGWHDTQGRFLVLDKDVPRMLEKNPDGSYKHQPEPLFVRVNAGDCVNFNLTNLLPNWFGNDAFVNLVQTNMMGQHIHLVKFDVLASDGSTNGWNYQQAAFTEEQMNFNNKVLAGQQACNKTAGCTVQKPPDWNPSWGKGTEPGQTIRERWYADYELRTVFSHDHHFAAVDQNRGQFAGLLVEPEKMNFRDPKTGQFFQPGNGNVPGAPNCGASCEGDAVGSAMDIIGPAANDDFREFGLAFQDFVSLTRKGGDPKNRDDVFVGPNAPEHYPDEDPGIVGVNYRNAPFPIRQERNGQPTDPAHVFSSTVHGDPATPVLQAYTEDPIQVRLIQGSQEHQHVFDMHGMRWREDPNNPNSPLVNTQDVGISEAFNFKVPRIECGPTERTCAGDYLYSSTNVDDLYMGMWGLLRARSERVSSLRPLPDNDPGVVDATPTPAESTSPGSATSMAPPEATSPGTACPTGAPVTKYNVVAMEQRLQYNEEGDHDPFGLIYALAEDEAAIRAGDKKPEPLTLRANEGDCIEVRLTNKLTQNWLNSHGNAGTNGDAMQPLEPDTGTRAGLRVSLHPQIVKYDVRGSDGTAVGYNRDQTVAPGDSRLYRWYADDVGTGEIGSTNLTDFGDVRGHRHHGLFAGLNIEPKGSTYHDPMTGDPIKSGASADIRVPGADNDFREFSLYFQDGLNLREAGGAAVEPPPDPAPEPGEPPEPPEPAGPAHDHIDQGEKGFSYGTAPFRHRLGREAATATATNPLDGGQMANVYNSAVHGDPSTPIFRAFAGDRVRMRVLQGADKQRQHTFEQLGHAWRQFPDDPGSPLVSALGGFSVGRSLNVHIPSAGNGFAGDYRYADGMYRHNLSGGLWGLMRVYKAPSAAQAINPTPIGNADNPHAGGHPIMPLEIRNVATSLTLGASPAAVQPGGATTLSGKLSATGGPLARRAVTVESRPVGSTAAFAPVQDGQLTTDAEGNFRLPGVVPERATEYRAVFAGNTGSGLGRSVSAVRQVSVMGETTLRATGTPVSYGQPATVAGTLIKDGTALVGESLTLEQRPAGETGFAPVGGPVNTVANGRFTFTGLKPLKNTEYRVAFAGDTAAGLRPSEAVVEVEVRAAVSLNAAGADLKLGRARTISGAVAPAHAGEVQLVVKRNGATALTKTLPLNASSRFAYNYKPRSVGNYTVQATFAGDADHAAGASVVRKFKVVR